MTCQCCNSSFQHLCGDLPVLVSQWLGPFAFPRRTCCESLAAHADPRFVSAVRVEAAAPGMLRALIVGREHHLARSPAPAQQALQAQRLGKHRDVEEAKICLGSFSTSHSDGPSIAVFCCPWLARARLCRDLVLVQGFGHKSSSYSVTRPPVSLPTFTCFQDSPATTGQDFWQANYRLRLHVVSSADIFPQRLHETRDLPMRDVSGWHVSFRCRYLLQATMGPSSTTACAHVKTPWKVTDNRHLYRQSLTTVVTERHCECCAIVCVVRREV